MTTRIHVEGVSKKLCKSMKRGMLYGLQDVGRAFVGLGPTNKTMLRPGEFWALQDISFTAKASSIVGIVGNNGSGKTTLLRLINGIFPIDKGRITIHGKIAPLISVGAGFHPHMTGRENIFLKGAVLGIPRADIKRYFNKIVDFAGLADFLDMPLSAYSSGMKIRLGFSIAVHCPIQILLADEVLAVGDGPFRLKSLERISELKESGVTIIMVSHNADHIARHCDQALVLDAGQGHFWGNAREALDYYHENFAKKVQPTYKFRIEENASSGITFAGIESDPPMINEVVCVDKGNLQVEIKLDVSQTIEDLECVVHLDVDAKGITFSEISSTTTHREMKLLPGRRSIIIVMEEIPLQGVDATLTLVLKKPSQESPVLALRNIIVRLAKDERFRRLGMVNTTFALK